MGSDIAPNGFNEYKREILGRLDRQGIQLDRIEGRMNKISNECATLRGSSKVWGAIAGGVAGLVGVLAASFLRGQ